ncbi:hypothetical protein [Paenibacillus castaneae]|nr:hypothetical protein [Paenibacillus castaneae]
MGKWSMRCDVCFILFSTNWVAMGAAMTIASLPTVLITFCLVSG